MTSFDFPPTPNRCPDAYGPITTYNRLRCSQVAHGFFLDGKQRAKERFERQNEMAQRLEDPNLSERREQIWKHSGRLEAKYLRFLRTKEGLSNYQTIKTIGKGFFGEVRLVRKIQDGKVYALKRLVKTQMISKDQLPRVRAERDALAESDSEWVVKLYTTFQDNTSLYMLMEFLPGGDLMTMLIKYQIFSEDITRFYSAEIINAIEAVHNLGFIHRDIKPDNILLDRGGHVKLADFGLSTGFRKSHDSSYYQELLQKPPAQPDNVLRSQNRNSVNIDEISLTVSNRAQINDWRRSRRLMAYSAVGTPDYIAPELFTKQGYSFDIDWWSLGTIIYECLVGWPPFAAENPYDTYRKIVNWPHTLFFPDDVPLSPIAIHLIRSMVCNSEQRLGRNGASEIKNHPFFAGVDFSSLRNIIRAPFVPPLVSDVDTSCFPVDELPQTTTTDNNDSSSTGATGTGRVEDDQTPTPEMTLPFIGYTFKRFEKTFV
ncbi:kinase-like domain-containing protein [Diplogelasinospora grovesii]|uniref:non-specific serine/threonine protein kinase n=1 Tax=Diplogelasinospora grovesii TaxID=303347 RepID=A0AAN6NE51_9PEZI|nr:kinase-like domain-containing protein [Diplogelasinospora grovesii]